MEEEKIIDNETIQNRLASGENPSKIFDFIDHTNFRYPLLVLIHNKGWNYIDRNKKILWKEEKWFDWVGRLRNGLTIVSIEGKGSNFIDANGTLLWKGDKWLDSCDEFQDDFAQVQMKDKGWNFLNTQGQLLIKDDKRCEFCYPFDGESANIIIDGDTYTLNRQGDLSLVKK